MPLPPLVVAVLAFLTGFLPALRFSPPDLPLLAAAVVLLLASRLLSSRLPSAEPYPLAMLAGVFAAAGAALGAARASTSDCRALLPDRTPVEVVGVLGAGVFADEISEGPPLLPLEHATIRSGGRECHAAVRGILPPDAPTALAGSRVTMEAVWMQSRRHGAPGGWPADGYRAGYLRATGRVRVDPPSFRENPFLTLRGLSEQHLLRLFPRHFGVVEALLLGRRERIDPAMQDRFARAGLSHLLAISGSHVGILAGVLLVVGGALRMPRRRITWSTIGCIAVYLALIGAPASAVRAGAMLSLVLLGSLLQRPAAVTPIAAAAFLLLVAREPLSVLDIGMQLSFAGVLGIIAAQRTIGRGLGRLTRAAPLRWLGQTLLVSTAAFVATAPITAYHFGTLAPVAILANVPAVPLTGLALVGVLAAAITAPLAPVAALLASGTGLVLDILDRVATLAAALPYGNAAVDRAQLVAWSAAALAGGGVLVLVRRVGKQVRAIVVAGACATTLVAWPVVSAGPARGLEVHFIDVGQGDAIALRTERGRWLLVDAGPRGREYDAGERRVLPFFRARGVTRLAALILTHPDADHIGGAPAVIRGLRVERVIDPGLAVGKPLYIELLDEVALEGAEWLPARSGRVLRLDGVELHFLWPSAELLSGALEANEASAITLLRYGDFSLLLPGDVSSDVEAELLRRYGEALRSSILKAGHHGSATSTSAEFLQAVGPELVVISAGRGNRYGHPAPSVLERLRAARVEIARTDLEGTLSFRITVEPGARIRRIGE